MSDKTNDGQLDHANREIEYWKRRFASLSTVYQKLFDLLKQVAESKVVCVGEDVSVVVISHTVMDKIHDETDEHEVEP